jgi:hypothetical protein
VSEVAAGQRQRSLAADLVMLTKPRIISLLLVTTAAPMYIAGSPTWFTLLIVMVGGYLMAGGANAVNMYIDQDIDDRMARTRLRPIPGGRMTPRAVLAFGLALAVGATWLLARYVNVLTSALALGGFYFYVFVYTRWLKRTTPQNIVIGGAAGAFPPLVGWAATTGTVDLTAIYLFLIVFYWTPAAFLGAGAAQTGGLRPRRRADGAGGVGRAGDDGPDVLVHDPVDRPHGDSRRLWGLRDHLPGVGARVRRRAAVGRDPHATRKAVDRSGVVGLQVFAFVSRPVVCGDGHRQKDLAEC